MTGTFREIINYYSAHDLEFDAIIGDVECEATFSFCGIPNFTKYCEEKYGDLLDSNAKVIYDPTGRYTDTVEVDYEDDKKGNRFAMAWAGYVSETEYDKLFGKDGE